MSSPIEPTKYDIEVYALGQSGALGSDQWLEWGVPNPGFTPLTVSFVNGLAVKSLWFPDPQGPMSFYAGDSATGTPFYTTAGDVAELVPIPNDAPVVTISGPAVAFFFYASSYGFSPFAAGTPPAIDITVTPPIVNTGTPELPILGLETPLPVIYGGSGSAAPSLIAGSNVVITGSWPDQTISVTNAAGGVQSVSVTAPITETGSAQNPTIGLLTPLPLTDGGTGIANPWAKGGSGIDVNGTTGVNDNSFQWIISNTGVLEINPGAVTGNVTLESTDSSLTITNPSGNNINLEVASSPGDLPVYLPNGTQQTSDHIVRSNGGTYSISWTNDTLGSTTVTLSGSAAFTSGTTYSIAYDILNVSGSGPPVFVLEANSRTGGGFTVTGYGTGGSGSGTITFDIICVGH